MYMSSLFGSSFPTLILINCGKNQLFITNFIESKPPSPFGSLAKYDGHEQERSQEQIDYIIYSPDSPVSHMPLSTLLQ